MYVTAVRRIIIFYFLILSGCAMYAGKKPEIIDRNQRPSSDQIIPPPAITAPTPLPTDTAIKQMALPQTQAAAAPVTIPPAALGLVKQAEQKEKEGDFSMASASLERALSIAPNSAEIYYRLARVREAQGQHDQAAQFARRGLAVGNADSQLQAKLQAIAAGN